MLIFVFYFHIPLIYIVSFINEQERAYMMLRMNNDGSDYGSWEGGSYLHDDGDDFDDLHDGTDVDEDEDEDDDEDDDNEEYEDEDAFDAHAHASAGEHDNPTIEFDPDVFSSDEAYARALQEAEEREMAARLLAFAGINDRKFSWLILILILSVFGNKGIPRGRERCQ